MIKRRLIALAGLTLIATAARFQQTPEPPLIGAFRWVDLNGKAGPLEFPPGSGTTLFGGLLELKDSTAVGRRFTIGFSFKPKGVDTVRTQSHGGTFRIAGDSLLFTNDGQETRPPVRFRYAWRSDGALALTDAQGNVWGYAPGP